MQLRRASPPSYSTASGGVILGKYQLGRLLGRGSFAKVYYARSLSDNSAMAVKVIDKVKTVDAAMENRIVREVAAMRRLSNHPNILKIHEVMATKTKIYLVMELAKGGDVSVKLSCRGGRFSENTARRYFQQLVSALHFCHHHGVAHRDIKPQNLLLDESGVLKLSDFGLSALSERIPNGPLHTACGTPAFAAPEVFRHSVGGYDGAKSDAWSCGVILFLFLAGYLPFDDSNLPTMYRKICVGEFVCPQWISKGAKSIIHRLLDPNPKTRMSIEALMGWFKNSSPSTHFIISPDKETKSTTAMNAFDIIAMSSGLDLSGLFDQTSKSDRERRFTSKASAEEVEERVVQVGRKLEYKVVETRGEGRTIGLAKGRRILSAEILTVAPGVAMVVVKVVDGGVDLELENLHWDEWRVGFDSLESTALSCHIQ